EAHIRIPRGVHRVVVDVEALDVAVVSRSAADIALRQRKAEWSAVVAQVQNPLPLGQRCVAGHARAVHLVAELVRERALGKVCAEKPEAESAVAYRAAVRELEVDTLHTRLDEVHEDVVHSRDPARHCVALEQLAEGAFLVAEIDDELPTDLI